MNWKKLQNKVRIELAIINGSFIILLVLLTLKYRLIESLADFFIYASTIILVIHVWWGAFFIIKYLRLKETATLLFLNIVMLIILFFEPFMIKIAELWALLFSLFFLLVAVEYIILYNQSNKKSIKNYIKKKIYYEWPVPLLFLLLYFFLKFTHSKTLFVVWCAITFVVQIFFALFLFKIKKVYRIVKD